jgi:hypothetical protein
MAVWDSLVLLGAFLAILASESVLLYASTALGNVPLRFNKWLLASLLTAIVWSAVGAAGILLVARSGQPSAPATLFGLVALGLTVTMLVPGLCFAPVLATTWRRGLLVSSYQLLLRALLYLLAGVTAVTLLRLFLAAATVSIPRLSP